MPNNAINDAFAIGALHHAPGVTTWVDLDSTDFADQAKPAGGGALLPCAADLPFALILVDASACAGAVFVKLSARAAAGDTTTNTLRVPAGAVASFGTRGLQGTDNENVLTISVACEVAIDLVYLTADFDKAN